MRPISAPVNTSVDERRLKLTREEILRALPRRSFFNCHDNTIRQSKLDTDPKNRIINSLKRQQIPHNISERTHQNGPPVNPSGVVDTKGNKERKRESIPPLLEALATQENSSELLSTQRKPLRVSVGPLGQGRKENVRGYKLDVKYVSLKNRYSVDRLSLVECQNELKLKEHNSWQAADNNVFDEGDCVARTGRRITRSAESVDRKNHHDKYVKMKTPENNRLELGYSAWMECKPLMDYLNFVKTHPEEYSLTHNKEADTVQRSPCYIFSIVKSCESYLIAAAYEIGSRKYYRVNTKILGNKEIQRRTSSSKCDETQQQCKSRNQSDSNEMDEMTEIDRLRLKAKVWAESVSTTTLIRSRIKCLQALNEDDPTVTKWWTSLRECTYLR